jgi:hypothetical protein
MAGLSNSLSAISRFPAANIRLNRRNLLGEWQDIKVRAGMPHASIAKALPAHHGEQLGAVEAATGKA